MTPPRSPSNIRVLVFKKSLHYKTVMDTKTTWRRVYYNPDTGRQVAVVVAHAVVDEARGETVAWSPLRVCFPHEHAGWAFICSRIAVAEKAIIRQYTRWGRVYNKIAFTLANLRLKHL